MPLLQVAVHVFPSMEGTPGTLFSVLSFLPVAGEKSSSSALAHERRAGANNS
jgi:hypothetical protein